MPAGKSVLKLPRAELRLLVALVRQWLTEHKTDAEILESIEEFGITDIREVRTLKRLVQDEDRDEVKGKEPLDVFVEYRRDLLAVVRDVDEFVEKMKTRDTQQSTIPSALRVKLDALDKIAQRGIDLGIFRARPKGRGVLLGGIILAELSDDELLGVVEQITDQVRTLREVASRPLLPAGGYRRTKTPADYKPTSDEEGDVVEAEVVEEAPVTVPPEKRKKRKPSPVRERPKRVKDKMSITTSDGETDGRARPRRRRPT